jgi:hypothetical protein
MRRALVIAIGLARAVEASLRPWHFEVVVDARTLGDADAARTRAERDRARFVVWRDGDQLVVFDDQSGVAERRPAQGGSFDAIGAAAAALTVKTMMRLPPLDATAEATATSAPAPAAADPELRVDAGAGARIMSNATTMRFALHALVRPSPRSGWYVGALGELGTPESIDQASFKGTWRSWGVLATARYAIDVAPWAIEPWVAAGVERSAMTGTEQQVARDEYATLFALEGGVIGRYRHGRWSVAAVLGAQALPSTPAYTMSHSSAQIFEIPAFGVDAGVLIGADLGL